LKTEQAKRIVDVDDDFHNAGDDDSFVVVFCQEDSAQGCPVPFPG
jgi:hypothetical protein